MIRFLLQEAEKNPNPFFSKKELVAISPSDFADLTNKNILRYVNPPAGVIERIKSPRCSHGCALSVSKAGKQFEAFCPKHPKEGTITIDNDGLCRYVFLVGNFLGQIKSQNNLNGAISQLDTQGRLYFIGAKEVKKSVPIALILGLLNNPKTAEPLLLSIPQRLPEYQAIIVLLPSFNAVPQSLRKTLQDDKVYLVQFKESFSDTEFVINPAVFPEISIRESKKPRTQILTPADTQWPNITIQMESNYEYCRISYTNGGARKYKYDKLGFEDERATKNKKPSRLWRRLMQFAENHGQLGWQRRGLPQYTKATAESRDALEQESLSDDGDEQTKSVTVRHPKDAKEIGKMKTDIKELRDVLQTIFPGISGDPIYEEGGLYKTRFNIEIDLPKPHTFR